jgi:hypothetical protein
MAFIIISFPGFSQNRDWSTFYEKSGKKETPRYNETVDFCKRMAAASSQVHFTSFGKTARGLDLPLLIIDKQGMTDPAMIKRSGNLILLIQACIHPGESEGKDAGLMLIRDLVIENKYPGLLDHVSILFIPILNVDGHERFGSYNRINQNGPEQMGWRVNANNLNLNRDYVKAETPEIQAWLKLFNAWMPDFFIDTHTTDGADYQYVLTYQMNYLGNMDKGLTSWMNDNFLKDLSAGMVKSGQPMFPYVEFRNWHDPQSGLEMGVAPPMLSQGYTGERNRPGLLIETHMLKPYDQRVSATYECLLISLQILNKNGADLISRIKKADEFVSSPEFRKTEFPLQYETMKTDSSLVDFLGITYQQKKSELTGGNWFDYGTQKTTFHIPFFNKVRPTVTVKLPQAYIIPVEWKTVIDRMELHGAKIIRLIKDTTIQVSCYRFANPKWRATPYEGRHSMTNIEYTESTEPWEFPAGSAIIVMNQPSGRIIADALEPKGNGSFLSWGFFDAIFEQKEYAENYVMEKMASKMLAEDPGLRKEFEQKKEADTIFAKDQDAILNWFYMKTPYWDKSKNLYPVGRIMDPLLVKSLTR